MRQPAVDPHRDGFRGEAIQLMVQPAAVSSEGSLALERTLRGIFNRVLSKEPGTARAHEMKRCIDDGLEPLILAHIAVSLQAHIEPSRVHATPLVKIDTELFASDKIELPKIIHEELARQLAIKVHCMSRPQKRNLLQSLHDLDRIEGESRSGARNILRHLYFGNADLLTKCLMNSDSVRTLEGVRYIEEDLSPSFVYRVKIKEWEKALKKTGNVYGAPLAFALRKLWGALRTFESFGTSNHNCCLSNLVQAQGVLETLRLDISSKRGTFSLDSKQRKLNNVDAEIQQLDRLAISLRNDDYERAREVIAQWSSERS